MSDDRILYYLRCLLKETKHVDSENGFVKLNKKCTELAAKSLAAAFYTADSKQHNRLGYIQYIRNLCGVHSGHRGVNESNFKTYLAYIKDNQDKNNDDNEFGLHKQSFFNEITEFYKNQMDGHKGMLHQQELINSWDLKSMTNLYYTPSKQIENYTENNQLLTSLLEPTDDKETIHTELLRNKSVSRESSIQLGYSVINLQEHDGIDVINNILADLKRHEALTTYEMEFIKYAFDNLETLRPELLTMFPFLLEQALVELSTTMLDDYVDLDTYSSMSFIKVCIKGNRSIHLKSLDICYELYALSGYSSNLFDLIQYIHEIDVNK